MAPIVAPIVEQAVSEMLACLCVEPQRYDVDARAALARVAGAESNVDYVDVDGQRDFGDAIARRPYQAVFVRLGVAVDGAILRAAPSLRFVVTPTTGLDHIDVGACEARGVRVISLRGETDFLDGIASTAEHTWALLLALVRRLPSCTADVLAGHWRRDPFLGGELSNKTLGVVGCGRLGRIVARYGVAFGMTVLVHDSREEAYARAPAGAQRSSLDDLIARADVVTLHLPLDASTKGFWSRDRIAQMKRGAMLVNTARGELVDEAALLQALESGHLAGVAVDVVADDAIWAERVPDDQPLVRRARTHDDVIITPHVGGYTREAVSATRHFVVDKLARTIAATRS